MIRLTRLPEEVARLLAPLKPYCNQSTARRRTVC